jgi:scyllo-inositol 2-dehydrogenase (NADP+)
MSSPIPVAILGFSSSARTFHLPLLLASSSSFSGADRLPERGLVVITTANATHFDFAMQAITHKCHVVVEKPAVLSTREADELMAAAEQAGVVCTVFQSVSCGPHCPKLPLTPAPADRRLDADFLTLRSLLAPPTGESPLGQLTRLEGGGVLWDLGSHLVDQGASRH